MNGHVRKRGKKYCVVLYLGRNDSGKRRQKWIGGFATKKEAEKALAEKLHEMYRGLNVIESTNTLNQFVTDWLEYKRSRVRWSTYRHYTWLIHHHLIPHLGDLKLGDVKPQHLERLYSKLLIQDKPLSKQSVHHLHGIIHQALARAVKWELVGRNVAEAVDPPRPDHMEMEVWTRAQVRHFIDSSIDDPYFAVFVIAACTGMRKGEIHGLKWSDIDLGNNRLHVRRALQWQKQEGDPKGKAVFVEPKTPKSRRMVTLPPTVTSILQSHRVRQDDYKRRLGSLYEDQDLVFTNTTGGPVNPRTVDEHWYACRDASNVPKIRFHDLRHTHASLLLELGVHPKVVSERLGHSQVGITMNLYSHVMPGMQEKVAQDFEQGLFGPGTN